MVKLYAKRGRVHVGFAAPIRNARMPSPALIIDKLHNLAAAVDEIMRRDFRVLIAQARERRFGVGHIGVMQDNVTEGAARAHHDWAKGAVLWYGSQRRSGGRDLALSEADNQHAQQRNRAANPEADAQRVTPKMTPDIMPKIGAISVNGAVTETS